MGTGDAVADPLLADLAPVLADLLAGLSTRQRTWRGSPCSSDCARPTSPTAWVSRGRRCR